MKTSLDLSRLYRLLGWAFLALLLLLLALEGWRYSIKPSDANHQQIVEQRLTESALFFENKQQQLLKRSEQLASTLQSLLLQEHSPQNIYEHLDSYSDFWGIALYQNDQPIVWKGFAPPNRNDNSLENPLEPQITLSKENNTAYWEAYVPFNVQRNDDVIWYQLFTSYRIEQTNPLAIGSATEFNILHSESSIDYPVNFSIFNSPPDSVTQTKKLNSIEGDSIGVVYASEEDLLQKKEEWNEGNSFWRSLFALFSFAVFVIVFFKAVDKVSWLTGLLLQLFFISTGWLVLAYTDIISIWTQMLVEPANEAWTETAEQLAYIFTQVFFALLASIAIARKLPFFNRKIKANSYLASIGLATFVGAINGLSIPLVLNWTNNNIVSSGIPLLDLRILPEWNTVIIYLIVGLTLLSLGILLSSLNLLLFRSTLNHIRLSATIVVIAFIIVLLLTQLWVLSLPALNWLLYTSLAAFAIILFIAIGHAQDIPWISSLSPLRNIVMGSIFIATLGVPMFYQSYLIHIDEELLQTAKDYAQEEDSQARELTRQLLVNLEEEFQTISNEDILNNQSSLQSRFTQNIRNFLASEWNTYSFDLQLVSASEELIANYSTNLNSPNWINYFNIPRLEITTEIQQITRSSIQPVIQQPQLINQQDYRTFYRGWIPVFGSSEYQPIAWILCSVYKERPQFNKPIRAVMASLTYEDWNKNFLMQKYEDAQLVSATDQGFTGYFPKYQQLNEAEQKALESDSLIYYYDQANENTYRTLLWKESDTVSIKISSALPEYRLILFSLFRFSFTLLIVGCLIAFITQLINKHQTSLLGENKRFQDRILDSFLLATLIFLGFLIATSHYAIKKQNQEIVRQELFEKLERLAESIQSSQLMDNNFSRSPSSSLESLTTPWNVDATLYTDHSVAETTTPQIYQQHLLPDILPYDIYHQISVQQKREAYSSVNLAGQPLLIGYRSILDDENERLGILAIPTFLESPKYDQQLLETISYLILVYILVFGLFILGSAFISKSLTRPLTYIQRGLNKISGGNLDTTIPVTSQDEIGNLAKAYNEMVRRLRKLQKELAKAEREAAWKEMAQQVAHEIKNPLTPMKLNVQHLERQLKTGKYEGEELKAHIQKITANLIEQIQSLSNIASDFSKFSQPIEKDFTSVNLTSILESVVQLYQHDQQITLSFDAPEEAVWVNGFADDLKRVFINIVKNAYESIGDDQGEITISLYRSQQNAFVEIEDNGSGIPEENRSNIFVPSFSTKSGGTGLGLAICKKIIEAHSGSITFASVEGEGTTFVIKLPQVDS